MAEKTNQYMLILNEQARKVRDQCIRQFNNLEGPMIGGIPPLDDYRVEVNKWMHDYNATVKECADKLKDIMNRAIGSALDYVANNPDKNRRRMEGKEAMTEERWIDYNAAVSENDRRLQALYDTIGGNLNE